MTDQVTYDGTNNEERSLNPKSTWREARRPRGVNEEGKQKTV